MHVSASLFLFVIHAITIVVVVGDSQLVMSGKFEALVGLCAISGASETFRSRSTTECVNACQKHVTVTSSSCDAINFRSKSKQCELYYKQPINYAVNIDECRYFQVNSFEQIPQFHVSCTL